MYPRQLWCIPILLLATDSLLLAADNNSPKNPDDETRAISGLGSGEDVKSRHFLFNYEATVTGLTPGKTAHVWLPYPQSSQDQEIRVAKKNLPGKHQVGSEPKYANKILYFPAYVENGSSVSFSVTYDIRRREVKGDAGSKVGQIEVAKFLQADKLVPVGGKAVTLLENIELPNDQLRLGRVMYDAVNAHMKYSKDGAGWGRGDSEWACDSRFGNCTDFHSVFISMARAKQMPAKFEMGFPVPAKRGQGEIGSYHCWAFFQPVGRGWIPVDISEANKDAKMTDYYFGNLTEDRVGFTIGRDFDLVPKQDGPPLNFFIYPYVEVDGKPYAADKVKRKFSYQDLLAE